MMPPELLTGIQEFNRKQFFECHETLEALWRRPGVADRQLIQGLIQIAVAYHHLLSNNGDGATKLFKRGLARLDYYRPQYKGIDLESFCHEVQESLTSATTGKFSADCPVHTPQIRYY